MTDKYWPKGKTESKDEEIDTSGWEILMVVPLAMGAILIGFLLCAVIPYFATSDLTQKNMNEWLYQNTDSKKIEYVEDFGDGNWSPKYYLYKLDDEKTAFNCWNKKTDGIDCKEVSLEEYRFMNR